MNLPLAATLAAALAVTARTLDWLTTDGMLAAALVGTAVFVGADIAGAALLALFFVSGSLLSRMNAQSERIDHPDVPGRGRTAAQVLANGLWPAVGAILVGFNSSLGWPVLVGALATAQADTWATEIGVHARTRPRLITSGRPVPHGTSGGVTVLGTAAGIAGATTLTGIAWILGIGTVVAFTGLVAGTLGMLSDSILGAAAQGVYYCDACAVEIEQPLHRCGRHARRYRGSPVITNDTVNFISTGMGALAAAGAWLWWS